MNRLTKGKLTAFMAAVFLAGVISGIVLTAREARRPARLQTVEKICHRMRGELKSRLELTDREFEPIIPILDGLDREIGQIQIQTVRQIDEVIRRNFTEMGDHLSSAQKAKLQSYIANRDRRIEEGCSMAHPNGEWRDGAGLEK